jgi:uncharacterized integral membrane protein
MKLKTIVALIITVLLTVVIMQNTDQETYTVLFAYIKIPKLVMLTAFSVSGFILGVLVAWPKKPDKYEEIHTEPGTSPNKFKTLSDEDRDYIN